MEHRCKQFCKGKNNYKPGKAEQRKKRRGKEDVGDKGEKRGEITNERCEVGDAGQLLSDNKEDITKILVAGTRCEQEASDLH